MKISISQLEKIIFTAGFYKQKSQTLIEVSNTLLTKFNSIVPKTREELLSIKGIGRKTANLVLGKAFNIPAICVDVHVHRISNRLGIIKTKTVEETETELEKIIPQDLWIEWNKYLVIWGQNKCTPRKPKCSRCAINLLCQKIISSS